MKRFTVIVLIVTMVSLLVVTPAFAAGGYPECTASSNTLGGPAPLYVEFSAVSDQEGVAFNWSLGDGKSAVGSAPAHTYNAEGIYRVRGYVTTNRGLIGACNLLIINVQGQDNSQYTEPQAPYEPRFINPQNHPTDNNVDVDKSSTVEVAGSIEGDGNVAPVINGDGNTVTATEDNSTLTYTYSPTTITIEAIQREEATEPVMVQKTNMFTAIIHAFLKANEAFFRILDESWFVPTPAS